MSEKCEWRNIYLFSIFSGVETSCCNDIPNHKPLEYKYCPYCGKQIKEVTN